MISYLDRCIGQLGIGISIMPRRKDIKSILILGSGPIIIGQACEFDYSGTQACRVLRKEGYRIILVNSNPATIMTDPELADATYIEPLTPEIVEKIIAHERPDAILPTVGGQTALNLTMKLDEQGAFKKYNVELLGANIVAIQCAESRQEFKAAMKSINLEVPSSRLCNTLANAEEFRKHWGLPLIIRPSFTLGGTGGGIARTQREFEAIVWSGLEASPINEILIEESVLGWKEYELELMRDTADNVVVICSIENLDPMGVHTGDSITVAPQQTLSDRQYQKMRNAAIAIIRKIGVATGGSNIQFAVNPEDGKMVVIEMNPRVSRSSALASKATGFPIAKIAAQLAVGYTLDEIQNEITKVTPCSFEPSIDYIVTKVPRFTFEKFPENDDTLGTMMHSVGECMSLGRTFKESLQKAMRSIETSRFGLGADGNLKELWREIRLTNKTTKETYQKELHNKIERPNPERIFAIKLALSWHSIEPEYSFNREQIHKLSGIAPWFLDQIQDLVIIEKQYENALPQEQKHLLPQLKAWGYSDRQLAFLQNKTNSNNILLQKKLNERERSKQVLQLLSHEEKNIRKQRYAKKQFPVYKRIDTCAGEFESHTPYLYSSYEESDESSVTQKRKVIILGSGPNRIGQGIEFDYCCTHASFALQNLGIEAIMVNSNPETVSTDYDISDKLYFEPLTLEDVLHICRIEKPEGIIVAFGGQTPLRLAQGLEEAGEKILGTSAKAIDNAENRDYFSNLLKRLKLNQAPSGIAYTIGEALAIAKRIEYPLLVRPSYVLGGRAMAIVYEREHLLTFMEKASRISPEDPILIDRFLENAIEIDVDALSDGKDVFVAGIMQHIEEAGVHSGDSACILPPINLKLEMLHEIKEATCKIAQELPVIGLLNIQFAICQNSLYVIEVNPRASRTVPFVSKTIGIPLARLATQIMCGKKIKDIQHILDKKIPKIFAVKEAVLPFARFPNSDIILGPEMKSTGEVMGIAKQPGMAYIKAQLGTGEYLPSKNSNIFFSISDSAKMFLLEEARLLSQLGFHIYSTYGTAEFLQKYNIAVTFLHKMRDKKEPNPYQMICKGEISTVINIPHSHKTRDDALVIRQEAVRQHILCVTTVAATQALVRGLKEIHSQPLAIESLQNIYSHNS